jgi:hypothetical protein
LAALEMEMRAGVNPAPTIRFSAYAQSPSETKMNLNRSEIEIGIEIEPLQ